jgi:hypothetical protein
MTKSDLIDVVGYLWVTSSIALLSEIKITRGERTNIKPKGEIFAMKRALGWHFFLSQHEK